VAGAADVDDVEIVAFDASIEMDVDEVQAGRGAPMSEQARLDVLSLERLAKQGIVEQIDLTNREVVRGTPIAVQQGEFAPAGENATALTPHRIDLSKHVERAIALSSVCPAWRRIGGQRDPMIAGLDVASLHRRPRGPMRDFFLPAVPCMGGKRMIESFAIDLLGMRRQMIANRKWKIRV
jgi:hypothetical protein